MNFTTYPNMNLFRLFQSFLWILLFALIIFRCYSPKNYLDPAGPKFSGNYSELPTITKDTLKVVSFNIKYSRKIKQAIRELDSIPEIKSADILLLQEMNESGSDKIARALGYNYIYYPATLHPQIDSNFGNAVLTRWPIKKDKKILLPYEPSLGRTKRIAVSAQISVGKRSIVAYSVHTATIILSPNKRLKQADSLLNSISMNDQHIVIGGDFNTFFSQNIRDLDAIFSKNRFLRATREVGPTLKRGPFKFRMDHLYVKGFEIIDAGTVLTDASDHQPIWAILLIE
jgi:endonuclease/exonuclease/phosphatase family metal-dependent hydrolase